VAVSFPTFQFSAQRCGCDYETLSHITDDMLTPAIRYYFFFFHYFHFRIRMGPFSAPLDQTQLNPAPESQGEIVENIDRVPF
jgi:hypothetical protein